ncbi:MAG: polyphosphate polymerase domain-containing protein [bacterium]
MQTAAAPVGSHQTMNRYEVKYLVATRKVPELLSEIAPYTRQDPHSPEWGYPIHSIYWDTRDFTLFWEKIEGVKFRRKLRFRRYGDSPDIFVEIKQREDRTVQKRRIRLPLADTLAAFGEGGSSLDWDLVAGDTVATEVALMIERLRLRPRMAIRYRRRALFGAFDPQLRITFDGRIQYHPVDFSLDRPFEEGRYVLDPRATVLEIKFDHRAPLWLSKVVRRHGLQMVRMSKYCSAVDQHFFGGENT